MGYPLFHPPTQETMTLALKECISAQVTITAIILSCFGGFRPPADDPPKPWRLRTEALQRPGAWVGMVLGDHGLALGAAFLREGNP